MHRKYLECKLCSRRTSLIDDVARGFDGGIESLDAEVSRIVVVEALRGEGPDSIEGAHCGKFVRERYSSDRGGPILIANRIITIQQVVPALHLCDDHTVLLKSTPRFMYFGRVIDIDARCVTCSEALGYVLSR
jgi:hypothetical protein